MGRNRQNRHQPKCHALLQDVGRQVPTGRCVEVCCSLLLLGSKKQSLRLACLALKMLEDKDEFNVILSKQQNPILAR